MGSTVNISLGKQNRRRRHAIVIWLGMACLGLADKLKIKSFMSNAEIAKTHAVKARATYSQGLPCAGVLRNPRQLLSHSAQLSFARYGTDKVGQQLADASSYCWSYSEDSENPTLIVAALQ